jgi:hypothetical protein
MMWKKAYFKVFEMRTAGTSLIWRKCNNYTAIFSKINYTVTELKTRHYSPREWENTKSRPHRLMQYRHLHISPRTTLETWIRHQDRIKLCITAPEIHTYVRDSNCAERFIIPQTYRKTFEIKVIILNEKYFMPCTYTNFYFAQCVHLLNPYKRSVSVSCKFEDYIVR